LHLVKALNAVPFVIWQESGARFGGGTSIVARKLLADGHPDPAWTDSGVVLTSSPTVDHLEDVQPGRVLWSDSRAATAANPTDLFAQSFDSDGLPVAGWPASGIALCTAPGRQDHARMSSSSLSYAWEDRRSGVPKVYVASLTPNGLLA